MTDPIADILSQIRNGQAVIKSEIFVPFSAIKYQLAKILEKKGLLESVEKKGRGVKRKIRIVLKYQNGKPVISGLKKISRPGQRIYLSAKKIRPVRGGFGLAIISTSKGLMADKEARKQRLGGEVLCEIW